MMLSKFYKPFSIALFCFILLTACSQQQSNSTDPFLTSTDAYLGQKPPGLTPELFAPGIVSTDDSIEFAGTFSPDGKEFYFTSRAPKKFNRLLVTKFDDSIWTAPDLPPFAVPMGDFEPSMTPDGSRIYFASARPLPGKTEYNMTPDIWFVDRDSTGWGTVQHFNDSTFYLSFTNDKTMYYHGIGANRTLGFICRRELSGDEYLEKENLAEKYEFFRNAHHPCVAKDESFLIFDSDELEPSVGELDMYVCFRQPDGTWGDPINLGDKINTELTEIAPFLSPDGKYLFYSTWSHQKSDIFWVSAEIINNLRPSK